MTTTARAHTDPPIADGPLARSAWTHARALPFAILGTIAVVGGSLLSAALAPTPSYDGNWAVAYIVLVGGVAQIVLGVGQTAVTGGHIQRVTVAVQVLLWNLGVAATVVATIANIPWLLYVAALAQAAVIVIFLVLTRRGGQRALTWALRIIALLLVISIPTGIVLQALAH